MDFINRQTALEALYDVFFDDELRAAYPDKADIVLDVIREAPSADVDVKLNIKGEWKRTPTYYPYCSICDWMPEEDEMTHGLYNYCPNCGAEMAGTEKKEEVLNTEELIDDTDVVRVIRCKDCKWYGTSACALWIVDETDCPQDDDYCSFGEKL